MQGSSIMITKQHIITVHQDLKIIHLKDDLSKTFDTVSSLFVITHVMKSLIYLHGIIILHVTPLDGDLSNSTSIKVLNMD